MNRYLERKIERKDYRKTVLLRCMYCCLHCCETCTTYLSKNAYILVINRGYGLLKAGKRSFQLLAANLAIVSSLKIVYTLFIWIEKLAICFGYHWLELFTVQGDSLQQSSDDLLSTTHPSANCGQNSHSGGCIRSILHHCECLYSSLYDCNRHSPLVLL